METLKVLKDSQGKYIKLYGTVYRLLEETEPVVIENTVKLRRVVKKADKK